MKRSILVLGFSFFSSFAHAELTVPVTPLGGITILKGMEEEREKTAIARQRILGLIAEYGDQAANQGISYSPSEWRALANTLTGGWMSSQYMPTDEMLLLALKIQNAKAENRRKQISQDSKPLTPPPPAAATMTAPTMTTPKSEWKYLISNKPSSNVKADLYVDPSTRIRSSNTATIWLLEDYEKERINNGIRFHSFMQFAEANCAENVMRINEITVFRDRMGTGGVVYSSAKAEAWISSNTNTKSSAIFRAACWGT